MARRVRDRQVHRIRPAVGAHARRRRRVAGAARRVPRAGGAPGEPDHAAARAAPAHAHGLEPRARAARDGHVLGVLPRLAVPRARARLQRDRHRPGVPAADGLDRRDVDGPLGAGPSSASARCNTLAAGLRRDRRGAAAAGHAGRARRLLPGPVLRVPAARARRRRLVPAAADDRHGRRAQARRGAGVGDHQRVGAAVRRDRAGLARHDRHRPHQGAERQRPLGRSRR